MLEDIRRKVMKRLVKKKQESTKWHCDVSPRVLSKLEKNKEKSFDWMAEWNGHNEYEVSSVYNGVDKHKVDMKARTCSCREWNLTGIPCPHSICTIYHRSKTPEDFVAHWYHKETYIKAYKHIMGVVPGKNLWPETDGIRIEPPMFKKMPGRPKKNRRKDKDEPRRLRTTNCQGKEGS
ncbi:hypothetical protein Syun_004472 [Stephania yunnanensis]|uniref:SWIM-type domain-containing protein n=1 Tax=Stephania yunnanensis TaxID=152371 RepID=A0AAP0Q1G6_9MAGN